MLRASTTIAAALAQRRARRHPARERRRGRSRARSSSSAARCASPASGRCSRSPASISAIRPREFTREAVEGKTVLLTTTNGTRGACSALQGARDVVVASYVNLTAVLGDAAHGAARRARTSRSSAPGATGSSRSRTPRAPGATCSTITQAARRAWSSNDAALACDADRPQVRRPARSALRRLGARPGARRGGIRRRSRGCAARGLVPGHPDLPGSADHQARARPGAVAAVAKLRPQARARRHRAAALRGLPRRRASRRAALARLRAARDAHASVMGPVGSCAARAPLVRSSAGPRRSCCRSCPPSTRCGSSAACESDTDRSWMIFLAGLVVLAAGRARAARSHVRAATRRAAAGHLGRAFVAYYLRALVRRVRRVGRRRAAASARSRRSTLALESDPRADRRARAARRRSFAPVADGRRAGKRDARSERKSSRSDAARCALEPPPEEMPAIDPSLMPATRRRRMPPMTRDRGAEASKKEEPRRAAAEHDERDRGGDRRDGRRRRSAATSCRRPSCSTPPPPRNAELGKRELDAMGVKLMDALRTFRVEAEISWAHDGPGRDAVRGRAGAGREGAADRESLERSRARDARGQSIRIVAPIPGRGAVGVEVPNPTSGDRRVPRADRVRATSRARARRCRSRSARISRASRSSPISRRCRTCSSPARRARESRCA